ncbi:DUF2290 domain-containing protein [Elizabethkingia anophelis]|uniref:DUF2290 domain-containing protein n=1 Tax=Elizabethkingia anophelis TaxID=1117645 RepID=UPI000750DCE3|nr:DUF2290 domain-containing protein [Elizabethkingia anophelis]AQW92101.1 hypothetical protein BBD28_16270 [Elizabethkingia anophelis]KUY14585.1 hypothetical protein ATB94_07050 [Elizabethkingia anophelis]
MGIEKIKEFLDTIKDVHKDIILTNNYDKVSDNTISWQNYKSGIFKNLYSKEYEYIVRNRQYSFLLKDNLGCIQFYYQFDKGNISKIKMAYYPYPVVLNEVKDNIESYLDEAYDETLLEYYYDIWEIFNHEFELNINDDELKSVFEKSQKLGNNESMENLLLARFDAKYEHTNSSHIRIDYDSKVDSHNKCEIQIGAINKIRIPLDKIISPIVFFDFIIKNILRNTSYYNALKNKAGYKKLFKYHRSYNFPIPQFNEDNIHII